MNENDAYSFDVEEPREWVFNGEPVWISGWFLSKTGAVFTDVRAVVGDHRYPGLWGLPHEHIERSRRGHFGLPHAGFALRVAPPRGARLLRIELCDAGGRWVELWRTPIRVHRGPGPAPRLRAAIIPQQLRKLLQAQRRDPAGALDPLARRLAAESAVEALETLPNPPFMGALEQPGLTGGSQFGKLRVEGWIVHQEQRIVRLLATTHPLVANEMDYGDRERADAATLLPGHPYAARSQFFGMADIDENASDPAWLNIYAELTDGTRHLVFARRFYQQACNTVEAPLPAYRWRLFTRTAWSFLNACRVEHIRLGPPAALWRALAAARSLCRRFAPQSEHAADAGWRFTYEAWQATNLLTPALRGVLTEAARALGTGPRLTMLVDARDCTPAQSAELAASLRAQIYPRWEAWWIGGPPTGDDARNHSEPLRDPSDFIRAINAAAHQSGGSHLAMLPGHSRLSEDALFEVAEWLHRHPGCRLIYTDEDRMDDAGRRADPQFKPDWSPALADSGLYPGQLSIVSKADFVALGSFRADYPDVPWFDFMLRLTETLRPDEVRHLPLVCHHARASVALEVDPADPSVEQARQALADAARRRAWPAAPFLPAAAHARRRRFHQWRWDRSVLARLQVTIVIPTRDRLHLLQECVELLDETVDWRFVKLIIVDDHSRDADAVAYLDRITRRDDLMCQVVRTAIPQAPFNYSALVNATLPFLDTPLVLHLNNDVNALKRGWLEEMAAWFVMPDVGVVGAKLVYPDKTLNHTGIVIGPHGGLADTPFAKTPPGGVDQLWHDAAREVSAVTGACLMTRTELYRRLGGFDEKDFGVAFNDVDYCLRVRQAGRRVIYTPQAKLMHWGSATRGVTFDEAEHIAFVRRYPAYRDPCFSPHLALDPAARVVCAGRHFVRADRAGRLRLLLVTHNLNLEGAPLFLLEYAAWLSREAGFTLTVLSSEDGPLRPAYEALGARLIIADRHPLYSAADRAMFDERLASVAARLDWREIDLVVCNTLVSFWAVHLARAAGKPSLWYIHESTTVFRFFERMLPLDHHAWVHEALGEASATLFLCHATRRYYEDWNLRGNYRLVPSWINLDAIETFRHGHDRAELRRRHGFGPDDIVIANIGTVCERKGQHIFIRAIDRFNHVHGHRGNFRFVMVGARPGIYLDLLQRDVRRLGLPNLTLIPETRDVFDFFLLADLFVCTSYEESFPRVVMEAMAFRTPIVSTDVHGIAEMIGQRQQGYLVPPGDPEALAQMMWTCLAKERSGKSLTPSAYSRALRYYDHRKVLPWHADLARETTLRHSPVQSNSLPA